MRRTNEVGRLGTLNPDKTRDLLLQAAKKLFASKGFDGTTVKELADEAGVNVSLVSYHFDGKEGLYRACIAQFGQVRLAVAEKLLQTPSSVEEFKVRLQMFVEEMISRQVEDPEVCQIVHRECELQLPLIPDIFKSTFLKVFETLEVFIKTAQSRGFVRKGLDPFIVSSVIFSSIVQLSQMDSIGQRYFKVSLKDPKHRKKVVDHLVDMSLQGVSHPEAK